MGKKKDENEREALRLELATGGVARFRAATNISRAREVRTSPWNHLPQCPQQAHLLLFQEP
jgi:hypothetical protein